MTQSTYVRRLTDPRIDDVHDLIHNIKDTAERQALASYTTGLGDGIALTSRKATLAAGLAFLAGALAGLATSFIL